jgi:hypothetical protein
MRHGSLAGTDDEAERHSPGAYGRVVRQMKGARTEADEKPDMGQAGDASGSTGAWWLLRVLYAILIVSAAALVILLLSDVVATLEAGTGGELHDLFVFDLAWPVFVIGSLATLVAGVAALIAGLLRQSPGLKRYATSALAYAAIAVALLFAVGFFEL